jgi:peptide/nickel transport system permease protein
MLTYIFRRLLISAGLLIIVSFISFFIITLTPGSPYPWGDLNPKISEAVKEAYKQKFHLNEPLHKQYLLIMRDMFRGTLVSNKDERPVMGKILERVPATVLLNVTSLLFVFGFGIPLGIFCARYVGEWRDTAATVIAFTFIALPSFWLAYLLAIFLVKYVGAPLLGLYTFGVEYQSALQLALDRLWHLFIPAIVLAVGGVAVESRFVRASMLEALSEDYIRTARAKGLSSELVLYKHALRNSLRPVITGVGLLLPALLGGSVIVESIFAYPGMGRLGYEAVMERDYPILVTLNFVVAALVLLGNLLADVLYAVVDPRVRLQ